jgi:asparagine N-glycosylation enzyme membrane subunit Stt3
MKEYAIPFILLFFGFASLYSVLETPKAFWIPMLFAILAIGNTYAIDKRYKSKKTSESSAEVPHKN